MNKNVVGEAIELLIEINTQFILSFVSEEFCEWKIFMTPRLGMMNRRMNAIDCKSKDSDIEYGLRILSQRENL